MQRIDRRLRLSGGVQARLQGDDVTATGQLKVDEGLFDISRSDAPTIGDDVRVVNRPGESDDTAEASGDGATERRADIQIGIDLGQRLRIRGRGLEATLQGALQLTTPNNRPSLTGTVTGMMSAFETLGTSGVGDPSKLSGAIGEVLVATGTGLAVAIPAFMSYYLLANRINKGVHDITEIVTGLFRAFPYAEIEGRKVGDEEIYAAKPDWNTSSNVQS